MRVGLKTVKKASLALISLLSFACGDSVATSSSTDASIDAGLIADASVSQDAEAIEDVITPIKIEESEQRDGEPSAGYDALINRGYIGCGVPYSAYAFVNTNTPENLKLQGRTGLNENLPYNQTAFVTSSSVTVVSPNCLNCHATFFEGQLVMGLGDVNTDYTNDVSEAAELAGLLISDPAERVEWRKWADRVQTISPYILTDVIGVNPADNLAAILFSHREPETLAWSETPLIPPPAKHVVPVDVPPWWRMNKKNAMFYTAAGRGDHGRIMMTASTLCIDDVAKAAEIDVYFNDIRAYIASLEAPAYTQAINDQLAEQGRAVFNDKCARCHGTYGESETYPNLLIPLEEIKTDPLMAEGSSGYAGPYVDWFNNSFYGQTAYLEPLAGYVAPPLDGIWITAPYFHNGSVPDLALVLDSTKRPKYWQRSFRNDDYNYETLGWNYTESAVGHEDIPSADARKRVYDTTLLGYSNQGHTYGDTLDETQRSALLEYLKTL